MNNRTQDPIEYQSSLNIESFVMVLLAVSVGTLAAVIILPSWMPNLANSLMGDNPKAFWYLSRGSSFVALSLLWVSMALGLTITNKMARTWPGVAAAFAIHEYVSLLGLGFAIFHGIILMGDKYISFSLAQVLIPFTTADYRPLMVGVGQVSFYVWLLVALSFYVRGQIGQKTWRVIHYISFIVYCAAVYHGITSGTDTGTSWAQGYYWFSGGSISLLLIYRIFVSILAKFNKPAVKAVTAAAPAVTRESTPSA